MSKKINYGNVDWSSLLDNNTKAQSRLTLMVDHDIYLKIKKLDNIKINKLFRTLFAADNLKKGEYNE